MIVSLIKVTVSETLQRKKFVIKDFFSKCDQIFDEKFIFGAAKNVNIYIPFTWNFIKKETLAQVFSCEFCEISKNTFSYRTPLDDCF